MSCSGGGTVMKGILLAGGNGTRLYPLTKAMSKQLMPIYDKPMIYYSLSVLMLAGIREVLIITTKRDYEAFQQLLGDGRDIGMDFQYAIQEQPNGIAEAFLIGEQFIGNSPVALMLGDNLFYGSDFGNRVKEAAQITTGAAVFGCHVKNPSAYGVVEVNEKMDILSIEEKPKYPKSSIAIAGLYFFDNEVVRIAKTVKPSERGELEIISVLQHYLNRNRLAVEFAGRGIAWLDMGTHDSRLEASQFVEAIQKRQGLYIAAIEEIAYYKKYITREQLIQLAAPYRETNYGKYLVEIATTNQMLEKQR